MSVRSRIALRNISNPFLLLIIFWSGQALSVECIAVVSSGVNNYWKQVISGAQQAAQEIGVTIFDRSAITDDNSTAQHYIIKQAIYKKKCKGLLIAPNNQVQLADIELLKQHGIPTVYMDRDIGGARISVVKTNNKLAGKLAGQAMIKALKGKGKVAIFGFQKNIISTDIRQSSFIEEVTKAGIKITKIEYLGVSLANARTRALEILKNEENIEAILTINETSTVATILALKMADLPEKLIHIGFDTNQLTVDALRNETLYGFVFQDAFKIGYYGVHTLYKAMHGKKIRKKISTNSIFIDSNNINDANILNKIKAYQE
jgi:ribose transport system substrate-binding protein